MTVIGATRPTDPGSVAPSREKYPIYTRDELNAVLRQGEIISELTRYDYDLPTGKVAATEHLIGIVASQDCDLLQDFIAEEPSQCGISLPHVLVYQAVHPGLEADAKALVGGGDIWKRVCQNKDERYAFLEAVPPEQDLKGVGLPRLVVDFKKYFTVPTVQLYFQINNADAERRCRLLGPYLEHFQRRACAFQARVVLPLGHES